MPMPRTGTTRARNGARTLERGTDDATATAEEDARDDSARDGRSTMDSLAADNLRLRREWARPSSCSRWRRREAGGGARELDHVETRCADLARELRERGEHWIAWTRRWRRCRGNSTESPREREHEGRFARRFGVCRTRGSYLEGKRTARATRTRRPGGEVGSDCDGTRPRRS